jgi:hypothetical protein
LGGETHKYVVSEHRTQGFSKATRREKEPEKLLGITTGRHQSPRLDPLIPAAMRQFKKKIAAG